MESTITVIKNPLLTGYWDDETLTIMQGTMVVAQEDGVFSQSDVDAMMRWHANQLYALQVSQMEDRIVAIVLQRIEPQDVPDYCFLRQDGEGNLWGGIGNNRMPIERDEQEWQIMCQEYSRRCLNHMVPELENVPARYECGQWIFDNTAARHLLSSGFRRW